jgi:cytochrome c oxidase cbb3-type subunit I/II
MSPGSIMPPYPWLLDNPIDTGSTAAKIRALQKMGVPYPEGYDRKANSELMQQANGIRINLKLDKIETPSNREVIALIAYLQRLGKDITAMPKSTTALK